MSEKKLESRVVAIPNAGQFLVEYIEDDNQDYARKPALGFKADIQRKPAKSEYSGSNTLGFRADISRKKPVEKPDELELWRQNVKIWKQDVKNYIKQRLELDEPDGQYKKTKIGFKTEAEKPQRYDIKITPINHIVLPTKPQQL